MAPLSLPWLLAALVASRLSGSAAEGGAELALSPGSALHDLAWVTSSDAFTFVHIPKTGGTSVEEQMKKQGKKSPLYIWATFLGGNHSHECITSGEISSWHMTVAQAKRCNLQPDLYQGQNTFCIMRDPVDRVVSELHWRKKLALGHEDDCCYAFYDFNHFGKPMHNASPEQEILTFANAVAFYVRELPRAAFGTAEFPFTESGIHLQPQSWYVFDEDGHQTCDKVGLTDDIRFEAWENAAATEVPKGGWGFTDGYRGPRLSTALRDRLRDILWEAYRDDFRLVEQLRAELQSRSSRYLRHSLHEQLPRSLRPFAYQNVGTDEGLFFG